jgi:hypothetical protein
MPPFPSPCHGPLPFLLLCTLFKPPAMPFSKFFIHALLQYTLLLKSTLSLK